MHGKALDTYCMDCHAVVCVACTAKGGPHPAPATASGVSGHHTTLLSAYLPAVRAELAAAKAAAAVRQVQHVDQLVAVRATTAAVDERAVALAAHVNRSFAMMVGLLQVRQAALLDEVAAITRTDRAALEAVGGAETQLWTALQGGAALTAQLLAPDTAPAHLGLLAPTARSHLATAARTRSDRVPMLEEIQMYVDPNVLSVLETVGKLRYLRAYGPECTVTGAGLASAKLGKPASFALTAISRTGELVAVGGDRIEARLRAGDDASDDAVLAGSGTLCAIADAGDGTYTVTYTPAALGAHRLFVRANNIAVAGSPFAVAVGPASVTFRWGGALEYDNSGILYHLATAEGRLPWMNPHDAGVVVVSAQGAVHGALSGLVNNAVGTLNLGPAPGVWLAVDLDGRKVVPHGYMLSYHRSGVLNAPRSWNLEGSDDGTTWTVLKAHINDATLTPAKRTAYWALPPLSGGAVAYSHFRLVLTGKASNGIYSFICSGLELYGELFDL